MTHPALPRGFTIIELLIVLAIISILAIFAVPAYHNYVAREQVNEGVQVTRGWRDSVILFHAKKGTWPTLDDLKAGLVVTDLSAPYVQAISLIDKGGIEITYGGPNADPRINGRVLDLVPYAGPQGDAIWQCRAPLVVGTPLPLELLPLFCRGSAD